MHAFRAAIEARDMDAATALLAEDVVFRSPVAFHPYYGRRMVATILHAVAQVFENFRYVQELEALGARDQALVFTAEVRGRAVDGVDILHLDDEGMVDELVVMIRPLSGALAPAEAMNALLDAGSASDA